MHQSSSGETITLFDEAQIVVCNLHEMGIEKFKKVRDDWGKRAHIEPLVDGRVVLVGRPGGAMDLMRGELDERG
jgi:hypothetical protein